MDTATAYARGLLHGERVGLRVTTEDDLDRLAEWWVDDELAVFQQLSIRPRGRDAIKEIMRGWITNDTGSGVGFSICDESGALLGHATLFGATLPLRLATFAIMLGPNATGHGYGSEATRMLIRYGFEELGLNKIELHVWAYNTRAIRAYEKAGFVREGVRRAAAFHEGVFHDEVFMGIVAADWFAAQSSR
ncbi:RimJ/RimL family protein N-acetyltransferase [Frondihabitans australicus]|uniref:RimJ/RimL family protein N-acetyltransferase n=2 Tax=Frondihabitans australicus TaxID=386892 RepID=A0A495IHA3_9MICO|nr:RimJ/RimL family protein N-acetyltransferase [Frondihabitans australicus]